jgi:hypothetical protein
MSKEEKTLSSSLEPRTSNFEPQSPSMDYYTEIESHFATRRGTPFVLSAKDWHLMKRWHDEGIPLPIVIEAIDTVFQKNEESGRRKIISSLSYCRHAVKELWDERRELAVGDDATTPEEAPDAALEALASELEASDIARPFAARVRELGRERSVPKIEERLMDLEHEMITTILDTLLDRDALREEVVRSLGDTSRLDEKTRARTEEANLRRVVRERFELPRLTLFR